MFDDLIPKQNAAKGGLFDDLIPQEQQVTGMRAERGMDSNGGSSHYPQLNEANFRLSQLSPQDQEATLREGVNRGDIKGRSASDMAVKGLTMNFSDEMVAAPFSLIDKAIGTFRGDNRSVGEHYDDIKSRENGLNRIYEQDNPKKAIASQLIGGLTTGGLGFQAKAIGTGANMLAGAKTGAAMGGVAGFGDGEGFTDSLKHAGQGVVIGGALGGGLTGLGAGIAKAYQNFKANPSERALKMVTEAAQKEGVTEQQLAQRMSELGDDAVVADVLGKRGHSLMSASNTVSPDARQIIETVLGARASAKAERVTGALEEATGYGGKGVQGLKDAIEEKAQPAIRDAYAAVKDVNVAIPENIAKSDTFRRLDSELLKKSQDTWHGNGVAGELPQGERSLSHLDLLKRELDNKAGMAFRAGDNLSGKEASLKAGDLRNLIDEADPQHSIARKLFADMKGKQEAVDIGAKSLNFKKDALAALEANPNGEELAHGFAAAFGDKLGGANATSAINSLYRPNAMAIAQKVLGDKSPRFVNQINAERVFDNTASKIGGSRTAEKYYDAAALGAGGIYDYANGGHSLLSGGATGLGLAALRRGGRYMQDKRAAQIAPQLAEILMSGKPPTLAQLKDMTPTERMTYQLMAQTTTRQTLERTRK